MKKITLFLGLIVITAQLVACGEQKKASVATRVGQGGGRGVGSGQTFGGGANTPTPASPSQAAQTGIWGVVNPQAGTITQGGQSYPNQNANDVSRVFLSTDWAWEYVGATTFQADPNFDNSVYQQRQCVSGQNCVVGMTLGSSNGNQHTPLTFANGQRLSNIGSNKVGVTGNGLTLVFWDSMTGTVSPDGEMMNPIPVFVGLDPANSYVQGGNVVLVFGDGYGSIRLQGTINGGTFQGTSIQFNNTRLHNGSNVNISGNLGTFSIPACSAFSC